MDGAYRNAEFGAQITQHVIASGGETAGGCGRSRLPRHFAAEVARGYGGGGERHGQHPQQGIGTRLDIVIAVEPGGHGEGHVRLAGAEIDIADEKIGHLHGAAGIGDAERHRFGTGGARREAQNELALGIGTGFGLIFAQYARDLRTRRSVALHGHVPVALDYRAIAPHRGKFRLGSGRNAGQQREGDSRKRQPQAHPSFTRACGTPATGASKASRSPDAGKSA